MIDRKTWKERFAAGGVCEFRQNYEFFYKWLLNKVCACFVINGLPETVNQTFLKTNLIEDGMICVTDFNNHLYACIGDLGGYPDEYYIPVLYTIANPILGSKQVFRRDFDGHTQNGVVIFNTAEDAMYNDCNAGGLYQLINQTATLLADNIISINANQINSRVAAFFTADSEAQAAAGEIILKKMYAGRPYQILRSDLVEKININPMATASTSSNITELVELHNYIISNFMQSIGIRANDLRKRERMITDEINVQNDYLQLSVMEMLASWKKGFDQVNKLYGTEISVTLNPAIIDLVFDHEKQAANNVPRGTMHAGQTEELQEETTEEQTEEPAEEPEPENNETAQETEPETEIEPEEIAEEIENKNEAVEIIAEAAGGEEDAESGRYSNGETVADDTGNGRPYSTSGSV